MHGYEASNGGCEYDNDSCASVSDYLCSTNDKGGKGVGVSAVATKATKSTKVGAQVGAFRIQYHVVDAKGARIPVCVGGGQSPVRTVVVRGNRRRLADDGTGGVFVATLLSLAWEMWEWLVGV
jgi:hypothetical protein